MNSRLIKKAQSQPVEQDRRFEEPFQQPFGVGQGLDPGFLGHFSLSLLAVYVPARARWGTKPTFYCID
jgi:hypothetical protein